MKTNNLNFALILLVFSAITNFGYSQSIKEEVDLIQSAFGMEKKAMVAEFLGQGATDEFWILYDQYETERKMLGQERLALLYDYAENYDKMTDEKADAMVKAMENLKKSRDKLISKYTEKIRKSAGSKVAAQFYQFENYLLSAVRVIILDNIPFIGEFDIQD